MTSAAPRAPERLPAPHVIFRSNVIGRTLTEQAREKYPQYTGILTTNSDGNLFCDSLNTGGELDLNDRVYFRRAVTLYDAIALQPAFGRLTGIAVLQIAYPVRSATGQLRSVLLASLNLAQFTQTQPVKAPLPGLEIVLVNDAGLVLSSAGEQRSGPVAARGWYAARVPGGVVPCRDGDPPSPRHHRRHREAPGQQRAGSHSPVARSVRPRWWIPRSSKAHWLNLCLPRVTDTPTERGLLQAAHEVEGGNETILRGARRTGDRSHEHR